MMMLCLKGVSERDDKRIKLRLEKRDEKSIRSEESAFHPGKSDSPIPAAHTKNHLEP